MGDDAAKTQTTATIPQLRKDVFAKGSCRPQLTATRNVCSEI